jgi:hypothetical protein
MSLLKSDNNAADLSSASLEVQHGVYPVMRSSMHIEVYSTGYTP